MVKYDDPEFRATWNNVQVLLDAIMASHFPNYVMSEALVAALASEIRWNISMSRGLGLAEGQE